MTLTSRVFQHTLTQNISLPMTVFTPRTPPPHPLIIYLHGSGERGSDPQVLHTYGPNTYAQQNADFPFMVVSPQCPKNEFWISQIHALEVLLAHLLQNHPIDPQRVYLTGNSMGGYGAWAWGAYRPQHFAAMIPICGGGVPWTARALVQVPVWAFHGDADETVDIGESARMVNALNRAGGSAELTIYPGVGHDSWSQTYLNPQIYTWLLNHKRAP